jgi:hypothetical protein
MGPKKIQEDSETLPYLGPRQKPLTLKEIIGTEASFKNPKRVSTATKTALRTTFHMKTSWRMNAINNRSWLNWL